MQTQIRPPAAMRPRSMRRARRGCLQQMMLAVGFVLLCTFLTCSASLAVYLVAPPPPLTVLVMGIDSREGEGVITRTDSLMLVGVHPRVFELNVVSIPRDVFIRVPGYADSQRINTINVLGEMQSAGSGPALLQESVLTSFGVETTHYVRMDFDAFRELIDAVGGVTIDVPYLIVDDAFPTDDYGTMSVRFDPGKQTMDGEKALIYARTRHQDDDYRRAERQQQVLDAFTSKALNPLTWPRLLIALSNNVDTDLSPVHLAQMLPVILARLGSYETFVLDRDYLVPGASGAVPDYARVNPILQDLLGAD